MSSYSAPKSGLATLQLTSTSDDFVVPSSALRKNTMKIEGDVENFFILVVGILSIFTSCHEPDFSILF